RFLCVFFFFSSRRRHTSFSRDWSSDVCSSDLLGFYLQIVYMQGFIDSRRAQACTHSAELKILNHALQARQAAVQGCVVAKVAKPAGIMDPRLIRVYFQCVQVKYLRFGLAEAGAIKQPPGQSVRILAEIAATCRRDGLTRYLGGG